MTIPVVVLAAHVVLKVEVRFSCWLEFAFAAPLALASRLMVRGAARRLLRVALDLVNREDSGGALPGGETGFSGSGAKRQPKVQRSGWGIELLISQVIYEAKRKKIHSWFNSV